jgi:hypothetical protein
MALPIGARARAVSRSRTAFVPALSTLLAAACASAPPLSLNTGAARSANLHRAREAQLEHTLDELGDEGVAIAPGTLERRNDPAEPGYWFARALAQAPPVRAALAEWRAARARAATAGAAHAVDVELTDHSFDSDDPLVELVPMLDVLALLGLGPSAAERAAAGAEERLALARVERAAFDAWLAAERARARLAALVGRDEVLEGLLDEVDADLVRFELLARHGRIGAAETAAARASGVELQRRRAVLAEAVATARRELAAAVGLAPTHPALAMVGAGHLEAGPRVDSAHMGPAVPSDEQLDRHPRVREVVQRFAVAEGEVRRAAALAWPGVKLGPHFARPEGYGVDDLRIGGMLALELPFPARWRGALQSAVARRAGELAAYEDLLLELAQRASDATARITVVTARAEGPSMRLAAAAQQGWTATRASFRVGRAEPGRWREALRMQVEGALLGIEDAEALALARLDLLEALGPAATDVVEGRGVTAVADAGGAR